MITLQFNALLKLNFAIRVSQDQGFGCLLTSTSDRFPSESTAEISRFCRLTERNLRGVQRAAALKIQQAFSVYRLKVRLKNLARRIIRQRFDQAATLIQTGIRCFLAKRRVRFLHMVKGLLKIREDAARSIQRLYYAKILPRKANYLSFLSKLHNLRQKASVEIQRFVKGFLVRKDLEFAKQLHLMIRWPYNSKDVKVVGTITPKPWQEWVKMEYSRYMREFYCTYVRDYNLPPGVYFIKFIVEGTWTCDGNLPISQDSGGNFNNVFIVSGPEKKTGQDFRKAPDYDEPSLKGKKPSSVKLNPPTEPFIRDTGFDESNLRDVDMKAKKMIFELGLTKPAPLSSMLFSGDTEEIHSPVQPFSISEDVEGEERRRIPKDSLYEIRRLIEEGNLHKAEEEIGKQLKDFLEVGKLQSRA
mmetsp:Transcript_23526/g.41688  ORF Transcript_23526/g.41688 Transcript_23526/m.41688 type:complete len:415 (-) Transcript_23526:19-1263(-)